MSSNNLYEIKNMLLLLFTNPCSYEHLALGSAMLSVRSHSSFHYRRVITLIGLQVGLYSSLKDPRQVEMLS